MRINCIRIRVIDFALIFFLSGGKFKRVGDAQPAKRTYNDGMDSHGWNLSRAAALQLS